jgi:hypothetical protein
VASSARESQSGVVWRRGVERGPLALRPRLSPGVPLSKGGATDLRTGTTVVKHGSAIPLLEELRGVTERWLRSHSLWKSLPYPLEITALSTTECP